MSGFVVRNCNQSRAVGTLGPETGASEISASVAGVDIALSFGAQVLVTGQTHVRSWVLVGGFSNRGMDGCNLAANFNLDWNNQQEVLCPVRGIRYSVASMSVGCLWDEHVSTPVC